MGQIWMKNPAKTGSVFRENQHDGRIAACVDPDSDALLVDAVRAEIAALPTYGYRRAGALANRTRSHIGLAAVNHKRKRPVISS